MAELGDPEASLGLTAVSSSLLSVCVSLVRPAASIC